MSCARLHVECAVITDAWGARAKNVVDKMRILMLNNEFPPLGGGTGTVNHAILRQLAHIAEIEIDLVTSALGRRAETEQFTDRIRIIKVPVNNANLHHSSNRELLTYAARALPVALRLQRARPYDLGF